MIVGNKIRVFKVLKLPVDTLDSLPPVMKVALGYEFFVVEDGTPLELDPAYGEAFGQKYHRKVAKLSNEIAQLLKSLGNGSGAGATPQAAKATIYLAECSYDRKETREILEGDLRLHGYTVLPDQQLPREEAAYVAAVEALLARCNLAVHLVGAGHGAVPDGPSNKSAVVLQNELAVRQSKRGALPRVIWLPEGTRSEQAPQQAFIEALHQDEEAQFGADLITGDTEALKTAIYTSLNRLEQPEPKPQEAACAAPSGARLIYLCCTEKDRKATVPLRKYLREQGFDVSLPAFEGEAAAVREAHRQLMITCDAVLIFYGAGDEAWKRTIDSELKKMPGYRSGHPLLARYTYLAEPKTSDKEDLIDMGEPGLIDALTGFSVGDMASFVSALTPTGAGS